MPAHCAPPPSTHPQVVILDLGLPDISGIEVLAGLRGWLTAPVIVLVGAHRFVGQGRAHSTPAPTIT